MSGGPISVWFETASPTFSRAEKQASTHHKGVDTRIVGRFKRQAISGGASNRIVECRSCEAAPAVRPAHVLCHPVPARSSHNSYFLRLERGNGFPVSVWKAVGFLGLGRRGRIKNEKRGERLGFVFLFSSLDRGR